jgi:hypothetical protein
MKYVMFECTLGELTKRVPIMFPDFMVHADCKKMGTHWLLREHNFHDCRAVSAGFINLTTGKVYGESESLNLKHDPRDTKTIMTYDYTHGQV